MRLDVFFNQQLKSSTPQWNFPLHVIGNGNGLTNVPKGATGKITAVINDMYTIQWSNGIIETKPMAGGMAMDLNISTA